MQSFHQNYLWLIVIYYRALKLLATSSEAKLAGPRAAPPRTLPA